MARYDWSCATNSCELDQPGPARRAEQPLDPVAPEPLISDTLGGGVYWSLRYNRGVRLRVMPIDSDAGWSALFFDTTSCPH